MQLHLPHEQRIIYDPSTNAEKIVETAENSDTALTAFFKANQSSGSIGNLARRLTYQEFPQHFVLKDNPNQRGSKIWDIRQRRGFALGRMSYVGPTAGERFYLRTLLMVMRGPTSFEDLKFIDGIRHDTFHDACLALGLLEDDGEWRICLGDAAEMQTGPQLRHLFATLLLFCTPSQPDILWLQFRRKMCDDLAYRLHLIGRTHVTEDVVFDFGLHLLNIILEDSGHSLSEFPSMPRPIEDWSNTTANRLISQQKNYDPTSERVLGQQFLSSLNADQKNAFDQIWTSIINKSGKIFFLDGYGGTGKTYLYQTLCHAIRAEGIIIICVASTGLACLLLPGGQTAHSMFKIPIDTLDSDSVCGIPKESLRADLLRAADAVIYDECLMTHRHCFEALDRTFQDLRDCCKPFGGITMIFGGDFQQILPVVSQGSRADIVAACLRKSYLWNDIEVIKLRINMRLEQSHEEREFAQWLLDIGHGRHMDNDSRIEIPASMITYDEEELIDLIYGDINNDERTPPTPDYFLHRAILGPRNIDVREINEEILMRMPGEVIVRHSADSLENDCNHHRDDIPEEFLRAQNLPSLPPSDLKIKIGCPLILLRNLDPSKGLCNGTRMVLLRAYSCLLEVMIIGGDHHRQKAFIPRIAMKPSSRQFPFLLRRRQFPVQLSFAMTINKAQGQSLDVVGLRLLSPVFCHGQLYVALSRGTSSKKIHVLLPPNSVDTNLKTVNVVYPEVLLD